MTQLTAYLHFNGNCREAMTFYQECLGGELVLLPISDSPMAGDFPADKKDQILHADLRLGSFMLMGDDLHVGPGDVIGHAVSLMLECGSEAEITDLFAKLSAGGEVLHPLEHTFWNSLFGDFTDQFGFHWFLNFSKPEAT